MKNVDTSLGEAPSIAERLRWGGSHGTALYFLLTVSTFPRHRCGGRCSSCRGQRMPLSLRDCRSAHHQNILSCAGMLSCTFPEIQHCSLHKPSKENPIVTLRQFFQFLHKGIRITGTACDNQLFIRLDILEGLNQISNPLFWHQTTEEQYVGIFLQSKMIRDQLCFPNLWPIDTIRDKMCLPSVGLQEILLHVFA